MRVVVCTVVHHPADARIFYREIRALLDAGHDVTYIAPHGEPGQRPVQDQDLDFPERSRASTGPERQTAPTAGDPQPGTLRTVTIPRAVGRRRIGALRAAKAAMAAEAAGADLLLVHDPELLLVLPPRRRRPPTVWDVHEDTAAALTTKSWLPAWLRAVAAGGVHVAEHLAERRLHLLLAEHGYNDRFASTHPVVPNTTYVPPRGRAAVRPAPRRVRRLALAGPGLGRNGGAGPAAGAARHRGRADRPGRRRRAGAHRGGAATSCAGTASCPTPRPCAWSRARLRGLSLLQDEANFRHSMPTKIAEYMARAVPAVTTPCRSRSSSWTAADAGFVVPFNDPRAAADAILKLDADPDLRVQMGLRAHAYALARPGLGPVRRRLRRRAGNLGQPGPRRQITATSARRRPGVGSRTARACGPQGYI